MDLTDRYNRRAFNGALYTGKPFAVWLDEEGETQVTPVDEMPKGAKVMAQFEPDGRQHR